MLLLLTGCAGEDPRSFVGELADSDSRFGLTVAGDVGKVYVCGGEQDRQRHHEWFDVTSSDEGFVGQTAGGSVRLEVDGDIVTGSFTLGDETFDATGTRAQGVDGLFEPDREEGFCRLGTVVANGGAVVQGVFCPDAETAVQVIPIEFDVATAADGFDVAPVTDEENTFGMSPVVLD